MARRIEALGARCEVRTAGGAPLLTDNQNEILDCRFEGGIAQPAALERQLNQIPGVVENGLFVGLAHVLVIGNDQGVTEVREK